MNRIATRIAALGLGLALSAGASATTHVLVLTGNGAPEFYGTSRAGSTYEGLLSDGSATIPGFTVQAGDFIDLTITFDRVVSLPAADFTSEVQIDFAGALSGGDSFLYAESVATSLAGLASPLPSAFITVGGPSPILGFGFIGGSAFHGPDTPALTFDTLHVVAQVLATDGGTTPVPSITVGDGAANYSDIFLTSLAVPEPSTALLMPAGLLAAAGAIRRQRASKRR